MLKDARSIWWRGTTLNQSIRYCLLYIPEPLFDYNTDLKYLNPAKFRAYQSFCRDWKIKG